MLEQRISRSMDSLLSTQGLSPVRVGVDIVEIASFEHNRKVGGARWLAKVFTDRELKSADVRTEQLATAFAAKEATVKVLRTGFRGISPHDIEVCRTPHGTPHVVLHGNAQRVAEQECIVEIPISLSRDCGVAIAVALGLTVPPHKPRGLSDEEEIG